ncbi:immunity 22 family protein [Brevibacillus sp. HB2.2]|uniref:immunity 22 family protein n=1 Tax=Brevibacillus sp. HB2.2 TaxID=2738846 RepID=UPI00156B76D6|nr:immunity 22 family protein [Brevibacillus sp. HB2.2]NRS48302.1 immunity 22 family protein [Brevibacillus sp. HB2.2]
MRNVVTVWGTTLQSADELADFLTPVYDEDGDVIPSGFLTASGLEWIDEDFFEVHEVQDAEARADFFMYLENEYAMNATLDRKEWPQKLTEEIGKYPHVILLYGNESRYGPINEKLFDLTEGGQEKDSPLVLLAKLVFETEER